MGHSAKQQIVAQLSRVEHKVSGQNIFIKCPFPEHKDNTPSFSVYVGRSGANSLPLGTGYCWGCGRTANWAQIADFLKLDPKLNGDIYAEQISGSVREMLLPKQLDMSTLMEELHCEGVLPIETKVWRGIPKTLLKEMGCFYTDKVNQKTGRYTRVLMLPCYVNGLLVGGLTANLKKIKNINTYYNSPGSWVKNKGYFGLDYSHTKFPKNMPIIITEGSRDTLTLIRDGYPACALLGSKVFSKQKGRTITRLNRPIIVFMDGDKAGAEANNLVCGILKEVLGDMYDYRVRSYPTIKRVMRVFGIGKQEAIAKAVDPASMPDEVLEDFVQVYNRTKIRHSKGVRLIASKRDNP